jgi:hypothetical protein
VKPDSREAMRKLAHFLAQDCSCAKCGGMMHLRSLPAGEPEFAVYVGKLLVHLRCK